MECLLARILLWWLMTLLQRELFVGWFEKWMLWKEVIDKSQSDIQLEDYLQTPIILYNDHFREIWSYGTVSVASISSFFTYKEDRSVKCGLKSVLFGVL